MTGNQGQQPVRLPATPTSTRYKLNRNWSKRGDNTKYKEKK